VSREPIPFFDLREQYAGLRDQLLAAVEPVLQGQRFILGEAVQAFEEEVARAVGARFAVGCASGSDALLLSLLELGVGPGDRVLCPAYTFFATAGAVARLGATPVFADVHPQRYDLVPGALRAAAARGPLAASIPVHLFGRAAPMGALRAEADALGVPLVEDAAQAIGAVDDTGTPVGGGPGLTCFSFFPSKNLGAWGDGGLVTTDDHARAEGLRALRAHGARRRYHHERVGMNSRLDALQAAVLRVKLRHLGAWNRARRENAAAYDRLFAEAGARTADAPFEAGGLPLRTPPPAARPEEHVYHQYVVRVPARFRDELRRRLADAGIGSEVYYPTPLHLQPCFAERGPGEGGLPVAERLSRESLALPVYPELGAARLERVVDAVVRSLAALTRGASRRAVAPPSPAASGA